MSKDKYGTGTVYKAGYKAAKKWRVVLPVGRGKRKHIGYFDSEEEALEALAIALDEREKLPFVSGISFYEFGLRWIEQCARAGVRTVGSIRSRWSTTVAEAPFAGLPVEAVSRAELKEWLYALLKTSGKRAVFAEGKHIDTVETGRPRSHQTVRHLLGEICRCLDWAVELELFEHNPARGIKMPRQPHLEESWAHLTLEEIAAVFALELTLEQRTAYTVAIYQGLRQGEIAALRWADVNLEARKITVRGSWDAGTKTGRQRTTSMLEPVVDALRRWRDAGSNVELVFPSPSGGTYYRGYCWGWDERRRGAQTIPERAGIAHHARFHDLRHTCAVHLVSGSWGVQWSLESIRQYLGHSSITVTERYARYAPDPLKMLAERTAKSAPKAHQGKVAIYRKSLN